MSRSDSQPVSAGFLLPSPPDHYILTSHKLQLFTLSPDRKHLHATFTYTTSSTLRAVSMHPTTSGLFALATNSTVILVTTSHPEDADEIAIAPDIIGCSWLCDGVRVLCATAHSGVFLINLDGDTVFHTELSAPALHIVVHPTELCAVICDRASFTYLDLHNVGIKKTGALRKEPMCTAFLPNELYGIAIGFADGTIELISLESCQVIVKQQGDLTRPILAIAFCPNRQGPLAFSCGAEICFATLPQWGFGHFGVKKKYSQHLAPIRIICWGESGGANWLLSVDQDMMCHVFEVPADYIPLYQPQM